MQFVGCYISSLHLSAFFGWEGMIFKRFVFFFQIWELDSWSRLYSPLSLHQSWVTDIQFCKNNLHMVTVGDKIAWWSLEHLPNRRPRTKRNSLADPFRRRKRGDSESKSSPGNQSPASPFSPIKLEDEEIVKRGEGQAKELLQLFDIRGTCVTRIYASNDFKKFVTVDDAGIVYILQEVDNLLLKSTVIAKPTSL